MEIFTSTRKRMILFNILITAIVSTNFLVIWKNKYATSINCRSKNYDNDTVASQKETIANQHKNIPFIFVLCRLGKSKDIALQLRQIHILLKSAATLTKVVLKFIVLSDSKSIYEDILSSMKKWPFKYQQRIELEYAPVRYPTGNPLMAQIFKPCSTYRLFIPDDFQEIDAVIYLDTDTLFMVPPEIMFDMFTEFSDEEAASLNDDIAYELSKMNLKFPGKTGLSSGVMLMNLTRLRAAPGGGFTNVTTNLWKKYKTDDQTLINYYFFMYPRLLRDLGCEWNYITYLCTNGRNRCLQAEKYGLSILHGNGDRFFKGKDTTQDVFDAWEEYDLGKPIKTLVASIRMKIDNRKSHPAKGHLCTITNNIADTFTKKLSFYIDSD